MALLYFQVKLDHEEVLALRYAIDHQSYCLFQISENGYYYGSVSEWTHSKLIDVLSGETLEQLEYLDETEFREVQSARPVHFKVLGELSVY